MALGAPPGPGTAAWLFLQYNKHLNVIGDEVRNAFNNESCADAKIVCDGGTIHVHRLILASASPWLRAVSGFFSQTNLLSHIGLFLISYFADSGNMCMGATMMSFRVVSEKKSR